jgi:DNA-binding LytR/AlgR family response regulator
LLTIAIYSSDNNSISIIKSIIQDFLIENKLMGRVSYFQKEEDMILAPIKYDIYIIDMDNQENTISLGKMMMEKDVGTKLVYISENTNNAFPVFKLHADYFLEKPIEQNEFYSILTIIR